MLHRFLKMHSKVTLEGKGTLGIVEFGELDFVPERIYWLTEIPAGGTRGSHAHKKLHQLLVVVSGSMTIDICEGDDSYSYNLNSDSPSLRLYPRTWRKLHNFSERTSILVLCDAEYDEVDYIRNFDEYLKWFREQDA